MKYDNIIQLILDTIKKEDKNSIIDKFFCPNCEEFFNSLDLYLFHVDKGNDNFNQWVVKFFDSLKEKKEDYKKIGELKILYFDINDLIL